MLKRAILLASLFFHCSSALGQESLRILTLHRHDSSYMAPLQTMGVRVDDEKLNVVSKNILMAENWLRTYVLSYYPSSKINSIVVANNLLCNDEKIRNQEEIVRLTLDAMENLYHSLVRWGLDREIKVSVSLLSSCLHKSYLNPVFGFLEKINSTYTINPPHFTDEIVKLLTSELKSMNDFGYFRSEILNVISPVLQQANPTSRKLAFIDASIWSVPTPPSPVIEFSPAPEIQPPMTAPASSPSPHYFNLPPCNPYPHRNHAAPPMVGNGGPVAAPPGVGHAGGLTDPPPALDGEERLWCVAKPSVPSEKLQEALDYACGAGGADCGAIRPNGSCYSPDSVVAHASYAFNSYWQKNKKIGGICGFEGTAMLISSDPSFLHCQFIHV